MGTLFEMLHAFTYLGRTADPRVAVVGDRGCTADRAGHIDDALTWLGDELPAEYVERPDRIARDWDVVVLCDPIPRIPDEQLATLATFVVELGGGVAAVSDYIIGDGLETLTAPCGFVFVNMTLPWSRASAHLECVPDY